jgi:GH24 family phage-related lysozyme (muramidase)
LDLFEQGYSDFINGVGNNYFTCNHGSNFLLIIKDVVDCFDNAMITDSTIALITGFEGSKNKAYQDSIGKWTIGVGHLIRGNEQHLLNETLSEEKIKALLKADLLWVEKCIKTSVNIPITQNQFDALASFIFNVGCPAFAGSTLLKRINGGTQPIEIEASWLAWNKAGGKEVKGLTLRRQKEYKIYDSSTDKSIT